MKKSIIDFRKMVAENEKIVYLTAYDYLTAKYQEKAGVDHDPGGRQSGDGAVGI